MATVNKNFRIKHGLVVEGTTGTINGQNILTETGSDTYILNLIGGETLVKSVASGLSVDGAGELSINRTIVDGWYDASGAAADAQAAAESYADGLASNYDAAGSATTAYNDAVDYADGLASNYDPAGSATTAENNAKSYADGLASNYDAAGAATTAENNAKSYADGLASNYDAAGAATTAENNAKSYADGLASNYDAAGAASAALADANDYTDTAVSNLVDSAPDLLNTLGELATALQENPDIISDLQDIAAGKQDALTAGEGIYIDGSNTITGRQQSGGGLKFVFNEAAIDRTTVDAWYDAAGAASTAQTNAESYADDVAATAEDNAKSYADGLAGNYDAAGSATTAQTNAENYADGLVDNLLNATTAFTEINVNDEAKQIAATSSITTGSASTVYQWAKADYRSAKFLIKIDNGTHNEISEILVTLDSADNVAITEYAIVGTNGSRGTISADVSGSNVRVRVEPTNNSTVKVTGTLVK